jgi:uncharacterized protein (TIRG00374 family)
MGRLRDPRVWLGLAITVAAMAFALRDVDMRLVVREFARANLLVLFGVSVPAYLVVVWLRALRWRHLTDPIRPMPRAALFRAMAVGFMANNVFPLRMGEIVRSWYLGRECEVSPASIFGTVILERVVDAVMVVLLALAVVGFAGRDAGVWRTALVWLLPVAVVPFALLFWLRMAPEQVTGIASALARPLPVDLRARGRSQLEHFTQGLGALRRGSHLFWIGFHSLTIWLVASTLPMLAGFWALDVHFDSPLESLLAGWMLLAAVGIAVTLPSAPGFFGVYHSACRLVLERFGMAPEMSLALGTLLHAVFWVTLTALGFAVLRARRTRFEDVDRAAAPGSG